MLETTKLVTLCISFMKDYVLLKTPGVGLLRFCVILFVILPRDVVFDVFRSQMDRGLRGWENHNFRRLSLACMSSGIWSCESLGISLGTKLSWPNSVSPYWQPQLSVLGVAFFLTLGQGFFPFSLLEWENRTRFLAFRHLNLRNKVLAPCLDWVVGYHAGTQGCCLTRTQLTLAYFVQTAVILSGQHHTGKSYLGRASAG